MFAFGGGSEERGISRLSMIPLTWKLSRKNTLLSEITTCVSNTGEMIHGIYLESIENETFICNASTSTY